MQFRKKNILTKKKKINIIQIENYNTIIFKIYINIYILKIQNYLKNQIQIIFQLMINEIYKLYIFQVPNLVIIFRK